MARSQVPAVATFGAGTARVLGDGTYDNYSDADSAFVKGAIRGYGGNDTIFWRHLSEPQ